MISVIAAAAAANGSGTGPGRRAPLRTGALRGGAVGFGGEENCLRSFARARREKGVAAGTARQKNPPATCRR